MLRFARNDDNIVPGHHDRIAAEHSQTMSPSAPVAPIRRNGCRSRSISPAATALPARRLTFSPPAPISSLALDEKLILKIFPPFLRGQFVSERGSLAQLRGRLRVAIPEIVVEGERDQWPYLVITRLPGILGAEAWPSPAGRSERSAFSLKSARPLPRCSASRSARLAADRAGLGHFHAQGKSQGCRARHERLGLPQKFLDGLDDLLRDAAALIPLDKPPVILTGEYIPENFLLSRDGSGWRARRPDRFR